MNLWDKEAEIKFFTESLESLPPEKLFYIDQNGNYLAYWPKGYKGKKSTVQSRNSLIGQFTEKWVKKLIQEVVNNKGFYAIQHVVCNEIDLTARSPGDVIIAKNPNINQNANDILAIIEVKMSIVWNWQYSKAGTLKCLGNYKTHQGNPSLLRSDSMLKAIGKAINIRVSSPQSAKIPIIVIGNTPITKHYYSKVDYLKQAGIIQGFWSINPKPVEITTSANLKHTPKNGFYRVDSFQELKEKIKSLFDEEINFFSGMKSKRKLGEIIELANHQPAYEKKAVEFLRLIGD